MLVLSRKSGDEIIIPVNEGKKFIVIRINQIEGESVKVGIDAPKSVKIYRKEVFDSINENRSAILTENTQNIILPKLPEPELPEFLE